MITCRETDEKVSTKNASGQFTSIPTGKKIPEGFKDLDYNTHTVIRLYRDEDDTVCADVIKDRTGVHPKEIVTDPTLLDWQCVIDGNKGKKNFVLKNNLATAVETEQEIYSTEIMNNSTKSLSKSEMEQAKANRAVEENSSSDDVHDLQAKIKSIISSLPVPEKQAKRTALKEAGLPDKFNNVTDVNVLNKILEVVSK